MSIQFKCPHCKADIQVEKQLAGQFSTCSECGQPIEIPTLEWLSRETEKKPRPQKQAEPQSPLLPPMPSPHPQPPPETPVSVQELLAKSMDDRLGAIQEDVEKMREHVGCFFAAFVVWLILAFIGFLVAIQ